MRRLLAILGIAVLWPDPRSRVFLLRSRVGSGPVHAGPAPGLRETARLLLALALLSAVGCSSPDTGESGQPPEAPRTEAPGQSLGIASIPNLRDLGGYQTRDGATVATGLVYRSNQLSGISPEDMAELAGLGLEAAYDLRTAAERDARPEELPPGVEYVVLDILEDSPQAGPAQLERLMQDPMTANESLGGGQVEAGFRESYREFISLPSAQEGFRDLFLALADEGRLPALFHCTTGKDRTGWAAAAFLTLMGVPRDVVMEDYLRSNDNIIPAYQEAIDAFVDAGGEPDIPVAILGVKAEYLAAAFREMESRFGTIENYFAQGLGIDQNQQESLREMYLRR